MLRAAARIAALAVAAALPFAASPALSTAGAGQSAAELPDVGEPFDLEAYYPEPIAPEDDGMPLFREAIALLGEGNTFRAGIPFPPLEKDVIDAVAPLLDRPTDELDSESELDALLEDPERVTELQTRIVECFDIEVTEAQLADARTVGALQRLVRDRLLEYLGNGTDVPPRPVRDWLKRCEPAIELWREGARRARALFLDPRTVTISTRLVEVQEARSFARLAAMEGSRLEHQGNLVAALELYLDVLRVGEHIRYRGCLIQSLVAIAINSIVCNELLEWANHPDMNAELAARAVRELNEVWREKFLLSEAFACEYLLQIHSLQGLGGGERDRRLAAILTAWVLDGCDEPRHLRPVLVEVRDGVLHLPLSDEFRRRHGLPPTEVIDRALNESIVREVIPAYEQSLEASDRLQARRHSLVCYLAAVAYRHEHGDYPAELSDATEPLFGPVPADPYSPDGSPLRWILAEGQVLSGASLSFAGGEVETRPGQPVIYSVGPDGTDDRAMQAWNFAPSGMGDWIFPLP